MITTTLAVVALAGALGAGASPSPGWQSDYAKAISVASAERKPVAVFIGSGEGKPGKMIESGTIPSDAAKLLRDNYVCVYVNTDTAAGKDLAGRFALSEGLVISNPGGTTQALRHNGVVGGADLTQKLTQYAGAGQPATTVHTGATTSVAAPAATGVRLNCAGGNCGVAPTVGSFIVPSAPLGSSCPNGKCPLQR